MSIVALKRKANAKYSTHSRGSLGFALNGTIRPRGRVGQTSLMSRGTSSGNYCCSTQQGVPNQYLIKKSVKNTQGMTADRFRWKATNGAGTTGPYRQTIYNQWVQPDDSHGADGFGDQSNYIQRKKVQAMTSGPSLFGGDASSACRTSNDGRNSDGSEFIKTVCDTGVCSRRDGGARIGGKHIPYAHYDKHIGAEAVSTSSEQTEVAKYKRSNMFPVRDQKIFPYRVNSNTECKTNYDQASDAQAAGYYNSGLTSSTRPGC